MSCATFQNWIRQFEHDIWAKKDSSFLYKLIRIVYIVFLEAHRDAILLRASALTFAVVLSMVPFLAMGTAALKGLGAGDKLKDAAYAFIEKLSQTEGKLSRDDSEKGEIGLSNGDIVAGRKETKSSHKSLSGHLKTMADTVFQYVDNTNFAALGAIGLLGMLISVISLFGNIESAMNAVWGAGAGRPLGRKVMDYLALLILLPFTVNLGLAAMTFLQSKRFEAILQALSLSPWIGVIILNLFIFFVIAATFTAMYRFLPNAKVPFLPALIGGALGALGWLITQTLYIKLQIGVSKYNAIYGSFATLPLFLIWLYVGWIVFLLGAELSFAIHVSSRYIPRSYKKMRASELEALAIDVMVEVFSSLRQREALTVASLAQRLNASEYDVNNAVRLLAQDGLLAVEPDKGNIYALSLPDKLRVFEVIESVHGLSFPATKGGEIIRRFVGEGRKALSDTIKSLLPVE